MSSSLLLAVPNVSEGRDDAVIAAIGAAFVGNTEHAAKAGETRVLDVHSDAGHHRSVFTLAGLPGSLWEALLAGARAAVERIDVVTDAPTRGVHPYVGAVDVVPVVYLADDVRGAAYAEALVVAQEIGEGLEVPVFMYGELAAGRTRAELRRGGVQGLAERMRTGQCRPDFGPSRMHPSAGATLVAARAPLVAFNLELAPGATVQDARRIASLIREGGEEGLPGVRAIGVSSPRAQVSMNVEHPTEVSLRAVIEVVRRHAVVVGAELVGLAPRVALEGFPEDVPMLGYDPARHVIENALGL